MGKNRALGDTFDCRYFTATGQSVQIDYSFDAFFVTGGAGGITFLLNPNAVEGDTHEIADTGNTASGAHPITITPAGAQTINGAAGSVALTEAGVSVKLTFNSSLGGWVMQSFAPGGAAPGASPFPTFVFRPGGVAAAPNVYVTWAALQTAYALVPGPKWVQFDSTFAAIHIPAGAWSLEDATCVAAVPGTTVTVTWDAGSSFFAAHLTLESVTFVSDHTIFTGNASTRALWILDALANLHSSTATPIIAVTDGQFFLHAYGSSRVGDATNNVISLLGAAIGAFQFYASSSALDHWLVAAGTASATIIGDPTTTVSVVTDGALVPTFTLQQQNLVTASATIQGPSAPAYNAVTAPAITRQNSGKFEIQFSCAISIDGGTLAAGDAITATVQRSVGSFSVNLPLVEAAAITATGGGAGRTVIAYMSGTTIDDASSAVPFATQVTYAFRILTVNGSHTSGILSANDGFIVVKEVGTIG